jgi:hypothetical protein
MCVIRLPHAKISIFFTIVSVLITAVTKYMIFVVVYYGRVNLVIAFCDLILTQDNLHG